MQIWFTIWHDEPRRHFAFHAHVFRRRIMRSHHDMYALHVAKVAKLTGRYFHHSSFSFIITSSLSCLVLGKRKLETECGGPANKLKLFRQNIMSLIYGRC